MPANVPLACSRVAQGLTSTAESRLRHARVGRRHDVSGPVKKDLGRTCEGEYSSGDRTWLARRVCAGRQGSVVVGGAQPVRGPGRKRASFAERIIWLRALCRTACSKRGTLQSDQLPATLQWLQCTVCAPCCFATQPQLSTQGAFSWCTVGSRQLSSGWQALVPRVVQYYHTHAGSSMAVSCCFRCLARVVVSWQLLHVGSSAGVACALFPHGHGACCAPFLHGRRHGVMRHLCTPTCMTVHSFFCFADGQGQVRQLAGAGGQR